MFSIGHVLLLLQSQLYNDAQRQTYFERCVQGCFAIHSVKPRTIPVVFVVDGSFDNLCNPLVRHGHCFAVEIISRLVQCLAWHCHAEI